MTNEQPRFRSITERPGQQVAERLNDPEFDAYAVASVVEVGFKTGVRIFVLLELKSHRPRGRGKRGVDYNRKETS